METINNTARSGDQQHCAQWRSTTLRAGQLCARRRCAERRRARWRPTRARAWLGLSTLRAMEIHQHCARQVNLPDSILKLTRWCPRPFADGFASGVLVLLQRAQTSATNRACWPTSSALDLRSVWTRKTMDRNHPVSGRPQVRNQKHLSRTAGQTADLHRDLHRGAKASGHLADPRPPGCNPSDLSPGPRKKLLSGVGGGISNLHVKCICANFGLPPARHGKILQRPKPHPWISWNLVRHFALPRGRTASNSCRLESQIISTPQSPQGRFSQILVVFAIRLISQRNQCVMYVRGSCELVRLTAKITPGGAARAGTEPRSETQVPTRILTCCVCCVAWHRYDDTLRAHALCCL